MKKQSFLALDIGTNSVRGFGMVVDAGVPNTHLFTASGKGLSQNIANVIDAIEDKLSVKFKDANITGNFGTVNAFFGKNVLSFPNIHKITDTDVRNSIFNSPDLEGISGQTVLHLIPIQFVIDKAREVRMTDNVFCRSLDVKFHAITYPDEIIGEIKHGLWAAMLPAVNFFDPIYLLSQAYRAGKKANLFIDFGKTSTKVGLAKGRGLISRFDIGIGQDDVTKKIAYDFGITDPLAEDIKTAVMGSEAAPSDQYVLADARFPNLSKFDVREAWFNVNNRIIDAIFDKTDVQDANIFITGHNVAVDNINAHILRNKGLDNIIVLNEYAIAGSFGEMFKKSVRVKKPRVFGTKKSIPIMPSIMDWPIKSDYIYEMFRHNGISALHFDMKDGFYTKKVSGTLEDLACIRGHTRMHIHAHLMVEDPLLWIKPAIKAGADAITVSSGTRNIIEALKQIKLSGKRCGIAFHPDFDIKSIKPELLRMLDDLVIMSVVPGLSGQKFMPNALKTIRVFANTRRRYGFKYKIIVDGGINNEVARDCWNAGADFLVSGNFLRKAPDFADAMLSLAKSHANYGRITGIS